LRQVSDTAEKEVENGAGRGKSRVREIRLSGWSLEKGFVIRRLSRYQARGEHRGEITAP